MGKEGANALAAIKRQQKPLAWSTTLVRDHVLEDGVLFRRLHSGPESLHIVARCLVWGAGREDECAFELWGVSCVVEKREGWGNVLW
jgi:hypothetical protein